MDPAAYRQQLLDLLKGCDTILAVITRFQQNKVLLRPYALEALFGRGVTAATPELLLGMADGDVFIRDVHGHTGIVVIRRAGDGLFLQGEYMIPEPGEETA